MKTSGIYIIVNKINNKMYIGSSENCYGRWLVHKTESKTKQSPLYNDMRKYGIDNFYFKVIEKIPAYYFKQKKEYYINKYNTLYPNGYNI